MGMIILSAWLLASSLTAFIGGKIWTKSQTPAEQSENQVIQDFMFHLPLCTEP